jgi:hypothetical protein
MLYQCAVKTPEKYIQELIEDEEKISMMEDYVLRGQDDEMKKFN